MCMTLNGKVWGVSGATVLFLWYLAAGEWLSLKSLLSGWVTPFLFIWLL